MSKINTNKTEVLDENILIYLKIMLRELDDFYLEVKLIDAPEPMFSGHKIRSVEKTNPEWYQELCSRYPRKRRNRSDKYTDSKIKRSKLKSVLSVLINKGFSRSYYSDDLLDLAKEKYEKDKENFENTEEICPF